MKMEIPLPSLDPSPYLNKSKKNSLHPSSSSSPSFSNFPSITDISPRELFTNVDTSASIPINLPPLLNNPSSTSSSTLFLDPNKSINSNIHINTNDDRDMIINTEILENDKLLDNSHNSSFYEEKQPKIIKDSSIMASSMSVVRGWRNRRCIHIDYVLGCRSDSNQIENVRYYMQCCFFYLLLT